MTHIPNKRQRKEESLNSMYRLRLPARAKSTGNLCTQKAGRQSLCLLTPILIIFALIISISCSGGAEPKSSLAEITELTVTINSIDYSITFEANKADTVTIPYGSTLPKEITVKSAAISAKATGLAAGDTLKISSGQAVITITAEDGSTTAYTLNIETEPKSSQAGITELTVTINSIDYPISFDENKAATVTIPYVSTLPTEIMVKTAAISAKAAGLAAGDTLNISSGKANITVTAEDGTTSAYTLSIAIEDPLLASVQARSEITYHSEDELKPDNYRTNILPFSIKAGSADAEGEYRLAVREAGNPVPTATDIRGSSAVIVRSLSTTSINVFLSFHMDTDLFDGDKAWTDNSDLSTLTYAMVDTALLQPETEYKLYAVAESGSDTVYTLLTHSTDAEPALSLVTDISSSYNMFYSVPLEYTYTVRKGEPFLLWAGLVNVRVASHLLIVTIKLTVFMTT